MSSSSFPKTSSKDVGATSSGTGKRRPGTRLESLVLLSRTWKKKSKEGEAKKQPKKLVENSYQLSPPTDIFSKMAPMRGVLRETIEFYFRNVTEYSSQKCGQMSRFIAEEVKGKMKLLSSPRYKFVCHVTIGQQCDQDVTILSCCLWNAQHNLAVDYVFSKNDIYAIAFVYAMFQE
jgi:hypothetical protein